MLNQFIKMKELLKSYNLDSYYNPENRFEIHFQRLTNLLGYLNRIDNTNIDTIWLTDYQLSLETKSKWNANIPFFCNKKFLTEAVLFLITQKEIRKDFNNYSISDFIFSSFKKEYDYVFKKSERFKIIPPKESKDGTTITIEFPINNNFSFLDSRITQYIKKFKTIECVEDWKYLNLGNFFNEDNYNDSLINLMKTDFNKQIKEEYIKQFYDFLILQDNATKEISLDLSEKFLFLVYSALLPKKIYSLTYLPTVIIKSNQDEITTGGFSIINYTKDILNSRSKTELKLLSKNWLSENSIADYLKILKLNMERDNNAMILHNVKSLITNSCKSWKNLKESKFKSQYDLNELDISLLKLKKRSDAVLLIRNKIRNPDLKKYSLNLNKELLVNSMLEIIKSIKPKSKQEYENLKKIIDKKLVKDWVKYEIRTDKPLVIEDSFSILISEIFDNAIKNNSENLIENPIEITVELMNGKIKMVIINDEEMPKKQIKYVNSDFNLNLIEESNIKTYLGLGFGLIRDCSQLMNISNRVELIEGLTHYKIEFKNEKN